MDAFISEKVFQKRVEEVQKKEGIRREYTLVDKTQCTGTMGKMYML